VDLVVRSRRVVTPGGIGPAAIHIAGGKIAALAEWGAVLSGVTLVDAGESVVMPAVVDTHVHVNEPGRTEWEGFRTATTAAAAGGISALVDMPLNSIPATTTLAAAKAKRDAAQGQCRIDVGFWGGVVPGNVEELAPMARAGVLGFKCFLVESGVAEFGFVTERDLDPAMRVLKTSGVPLLVHSELPGPIEEAEKRGAGADPRKYLSYLQSRPRAAEDEAIALMVRLCGATGARTHVVHHSSSNSLGAIKAAKASGLPFSAETCPHYLSFSAEEIPDGATWFKCAPPIREAENREKLWAALADGTLSLVASDHSPCSPALKKMEAGDFAAAWGGISGLQLALPVTWTEAKKRGHGIADIVRWMCEGPAKLAGLAKKKGTIAAGFDADLVVWRPDDTFTVERKAIRHKHDVTPWAGRELFGVVETTFVRGQKVFDRGEIVNESVGRFLERD